MRILITGSSGKLGCYLLDELRHQRHSVTAWSGISAGQIAGFDLIPVDLADPSETASAFRDAKPDLVIHAAAESSVANCIEQPEKAARINVAGTDLLSQLAADSSARMLFVSTDMVFNGEQGDYRESAPISPLSAYGRSKAAAERAVRTREQLVVRISLLFGPALGSRESFFDHMLRSIRQQDAITLFSDEWRTPLSFRTAARALIAAGETDLCGTIHLGGPEKLSRLEMGQRLAAFLGASTDRLEPVHSASVPTPEPRPRDLSLNTSRWRSHFPDLRFPCWEEALLELGSVAKE